MKDFKGPLPETLTLKPSRTRWMLLFLVAVSFSISAVWVVTTIDVVPRVITAVFFGIGALIAIPGMLGYKSELVLDRKGFTCATPFRTFQRDWKDCSTFSAIRIGLSRFVSFSSAPDEKAHPNLAEVNRKIIGESGMLPDTYGMTAEELAELLNRFRSRSLGAS